MDAKCSLLDARVAAELPPVVDGAANSQGAEGFRMRQLRNSVIAGKVNRPGFVGGLNS